MRILWVSDSPFTPTGYGQFTLQITPMLQALGHEIVVLAPSIPQGRPLMFHGVRVIGGRLDIFGNDLIEIAADRERADIIITCKDPFVYDWRMMARLEKPWFPLVPVDTEPLSALNAQVLQFCTRPIAITPNGEAALKDAEFTPYYAPMGVDSTVFTIGDKAAARREMQISDEAFVTLIVANNNAPPPTRKGFEQMIPAWAVFQRQLAEQGKEAALILHTDLTSDRGGIDLEALILACGIPKHSLRATDGYQYLGGVLPEKMAQLYRVADVLLGTSLGEGFWLPGIEAQMCGTPVIANRWTSQRDTALTGVVLPTEDDSAGDQFWSANLEGYWFMPRIRSVIGALEAAHETAFSAESCRQRALAYDLRHVVATHWKPVLEDIAAWLTGKMT